ncbi:acyl-CoA dehydrogenase family protein [Mycolicibacterium thermoresistibile]|uniref:Acyl-CoA dehydrogenase domain-containing protein n=2 Tax=Mycolicibacterium thermoresistibile TaxID=1797 RepID=G7CH51_MYCT3|nr:acyl-CoA dehydrogenase family protein [Mycolicibacterium thermoresistibile]EHI12161.1 acyl-CoA dehydrogenase domain-containing protein [Mycolicibacterium thermoresistibile ATCC 19527]MCV7191124.1 acyl-CoA/acyl-ACP dehydrogenase [Mycolicibacterium thermoresistibile]SNW16921.1 acyl-CoA dehydrogenase [Mycolicibacterium thermoresistibile]
MSPKTDPGAGPDETDLRELAAVVDELLAEGRAHRDSRQHSGRSTQDESLWDQAVWEDLVDNGFAHVGIAESAGGSGGGLREAAVLLRAVGRHAVAVPLAEVGLAGWLLETSGGRLGDGLTTVGAGNLVATPADGGVRVVGRLTRVAFARQARTVVALAAPAPHRPETDGTESATPELVVSIPVADCRITPGRNVAGEARDDLLVDTVLPSSAAEAAVIGAARELRLRGALARAVSSAGAMSGLVSQTSQYVREREQFGRPLAAFQAVQQSMALLAAEAAAAGTAADAAVRICAERGCASPEAELAVAAAKVRTAQAATVGAATAHQMHGAIGMTYEHALRHTTSRLWSWRSEWGGERTWADQLGQLAMNAGGAGLWDALTKA